MPVLYLRGVSTGDFQEVLSAPVEPDAPYLSPGMISRLTADWQGAQSWCELRVDLRSRGLSVPPDAAVGGGAVGYWKAMAALGLFIDDMPCSGREVIARMKIDHDFYRRDLEFGALDITLKRYR